MIDQNIRLTGVPLTGAISVLRATDTKGIYYNIDTSYANSKFAGRPLGGMASIWAGASPRASLESELNVCQFPISTVGYVRAGTGVSSKCHATSH